MELKLSFPDKIATPRKVRANITFAANRGEAAQPIRVDWGDGTAIVASASNLAHQLDHDYAVDGFFRVYAFGNDVKVHKEVTVGDGTMGPIHDPDNYYKNQPEAWAEARRRDALIGRATPMA